MSERLFGRLLSLPKPGLRPGLAAGTAARSRLGMRRRGGGGGGAGPYRALRRPPEKRFSLNSSSYRNPPAAQAY